MPIKNVTTTVSILHITMKLVKTLQVDIKKEQDNPIDSKAIAFACDVSGHGKELVTLYEKHLMRYIK